MVTYERVFVDSEGHPSRVMSNRKMTIVQEDGKRFDPTCVVTDSGNGYIVKFPSRSSCQQDYYVCLDYSQARDLVLALSAHREDLGFKEGA